MTTGHAHHFLSRLDRVSRAETELALALYRKPEIIRAIVAMKRPDPSVERLALGLSHEPDGPHIIVSRTGGFVTCLGRGMSPYETMVIPRGELDVLCRGIATLDAEIRRYDTDHRGSAAVDGSIRALADEGNRLSREDYLRLEDARVVMWPTFAEVGHSFAGDLGRSAQILRHVVRPTALEQERLALHWRLLWSGANATLLSLSEGVSFQLAQIAALRPSRQLIRVACTMTFGYAVLGPALRAVRAASYTVPDHLDFLAAEATEANKLWPQYCLAIWSLLGAAARDVSLRGTVRQLFETPRPSLDPHHARMLEGGAAFLDVMGDDPETYIQEFAQVHRQSKSVRVDNPLWAELDDDDLLAAFSTGGMTMDHPEFFIELGRLVVWSCRRPASALFLPRSQVRRCVKPFSLPMATSAIATYCGLWQGQRPVSRPAQPGRNALCHCGSGKKFKRCHGV